MFKNGKGSWTIHRTRVIDSNLIKTKCISFYTGIKIDQIIIFYVIGLGYYISDQEYIGQYMPDMNQPGPIPSFFTVYPCFIDLLQDLYIKYKLNK